MPFRVPSQKGEEELAGHRPRSSFIQTTYPLVLVAGLALLSGIHCDKGTDFERDPCLQLVSSTRLIREDWYGSYDLVFPVWSLDDRIFYIASEDVSLQRPRGSIWRANADGTNDTLWAAGNYSYLDLSPESDLLLAVGAAETYNDVRLSFWTPGDVFTLDIATSQATRITTTGDVLSAVFIADDRGLGIILFRYGWPEDNGFYRTSLDGKSMGLLYQTGNDVCFGFDVSPDGRLLVGGGRVFDLGTRQISRELEIEDWGFFPRYSPDGSEVAFSTSYDPNLLAQLYVKDLSTGDRRSLSLAVYNPHLANGRACDDLNFPYWSPDGTQIVFSATRSYGDPARRHAYEIWVANGLP